jgi:hypothetical protein
MNFPFKDRELPSTPAPGLFLSVPEEVTFSFPSGKGTVPSPCGIGNNRVLSPPGLSAHVSDSKPGGQRPCGVIAGMDKSASSSQLPFWTAPTGSAAYAHCPQIGKEIRRKKKSKDR